MVSLPYHHPVMVADRMVLLDHLTRGRVIFGTGPGALPTDAYMMGIDPVDQRRMMEESLEAILALLRTDEPVTRETDWFTLKDAKLQYRPYSDPHFEVSVAAMVSPSGPRLAGSHDVALAVRGIGPIVAADFSPSRRRLAGAMGATDIVDPREEGSWQAWSRTGNGRAPVVFEAIGVPGILDEILRCAPAQSRIVVAGVCMEHDTINPFEKVPLQEKPSDYFRRQCWISCDPDERTIPALADRFGVDRFLWASDFPHADHTPEYVEDLNELAGMFSDADRRRFLGDNARELFGIDA